MKRRQPTELGRGVVRFFQDYLPTLRGMSPHTLHSYRDALVLLLRFAAQDANRRIETLEIADLNAERVARFLQFLEIERHNAIATRNARLAAIHTFARFLAAERPEHLATLQRVLGIPFKRGAKEAPIAYLESADEPPRHSRRLRLLRGWSHEDDDVFPGSARACRTDGARASGRA